MTDLGLSFIARRVQVERDVRSEFEAATRQRTIPALVAGGSLVCGEDAIPASLEREFVEAPGVSSQREKAAKAERKELGEAWPALAAATR